MKRAGGRNNNEEMILIDDYDIGGNLGLGEGELGVPIVKINWEVRDVD